MEPSETGDLPDSLRDVSVEALLTYRKMAMATVAVYLALPDEYADAILTDTMDEYHADTFNEREMTKRNDFAAYQSLLSREAVVRYAGTAAEGLAAPPDSPLAQKRVMGETGGLGMTDDINVILRVHELWAYMEAPGGDGAMGDDVDALLGFVKRHTCNYYNACAFYLVREKLLPVVVDAAERGFRADDAPLSTRELREMLDGRGLLP